MDYRQYKEERQDEFNALPIFWAFSDEQFERAMQERGLTAEDTDKVVQLSTGGFCLKKDVDVINGFMAKPDPINELMKDYSFAFDAIYYEMCNHEYAINWQADWDVCMCFGNVKYTEASNELTEYFRQLGWGDTTVRAYMDARRKYYKDANDNEWF